MAKSPKPPADPSALSFEDALARIEQIIERIESGEVGLEDSLAEYERGVGLINHCRSKLDSARQKVEDLTRKLQAADEGSASPSPGAPPAEGADDEPDSDDDAEPQF